MILATQHSGGSMLLGWLLHQSLPRTVEGQGREGRDLAGLKGKDIRNQEEVFVLSADVACYGRVFLSWSVRQHWHSLIPCGFFKFDCLFRLPPWTGHSAHCNRFWPRVVSSDLTFCFGSQHTIANDDALTVKHPLPISGCTRKVFPSFFDKYVGLLMYEVCHSILSILLVKHNIYQRSIHNV